MLPLTAGVHAPSALPPSARFKLICGCVFLNATVAAIMASSLPIFLTGHVSASYRQTSLVIVAATLVSAFISHLTGSFTDRSGKRMTTAVLSAVCGILGFLLLSQQTGLLPVAGTYILLVSAASSLFPQFMAMAFLEDRNRVTVARAFASLGWVAGPPLGGVVITMTSYATLFLSIAGIFTVITGLVVWMSFLQAAWQTADPVEEHPRAELRKAQANQSVFRLSVTLSAIHVALALPLFGIPLWVIEAGGTEVHSGYAFGLSALIEIPVLLYTPWLKTRLGTPLVFAGCAFALGLYLALLGMATSVFTIICLGLVYGVVTGLMMGFGLTALQDAAPTRPGFTSALYTNILRFSHVGAVFAFGLAAEQISIGAIFLFGALCTTLIAALQLTPEHGEAVARQNHD